MISSRSFRPFFTIPAYGLLSTCPLSAYQPDRYSSDHRLCAYSVVCHTFSKDKGQIKTPLILQRKPLGRTKSGNTSQYARTSWYHLRSSVSRNTDLYGQSFDDAPAARSRGPPASSTFGSTANFFSQRQGSFSQPVNIWAFHQPPTLCMPPMLLLVPAMPVPDLVIFIHWASYIMSQRGLSSPFSAKSRCLLSTRHTISAFSKI